MLPPGGMKELIANAREQFPQLASLPDEAIERLILASMRRSGATDNKLSESAESLVDKYNECLELFREGNVAEAEQRLLGLQEISDRQNRPDMIFHSLQLLGVICNDRGDYEAAIVIYQKILTLAERLGDGE